MHYIIKAGKLFQKIDKNSDGKINEQEMADYIIRY
jgi:Ca2+-binding EF-hand superfamily protein